ncbi:hypothetical protein DFJ73DRAFT_805448 [Zopfochytrium polystomum]|nr:hypothetical protein DFJ73DRAFT_805448 [Zopfochytrium polystomum]
MISALSRKRRAPPALRHRWGSQATLLSFRATLTSSSKASAEEAPKADALASPSHPTLRTAADAIVIGAVASRAGSTANAPANWKLTQAVSLPTAATEAVMSRLQASRFEAKFGQIRLLYDLDLKDLPSIVSVVGLGKLSERSPTSLQAERARLAASAGIKSIASLSPTSSFKIGVEPFFGNAKATAEGASLSNYSFDRFKKDRSKKGLVEAQLFAPGADASLIDQWMEGVEIAASQNLARTLMETPANHMTPTVFSKVAVGKLQGLPNVTVKVHEKDWAESQKMGAFLSVARGSDEPLKFVEIVYKGGKPDERPIALVGKGVTFDTGGISIKPSNGMAAMKGDMGGAAVVLSAILAIARLRLPHNVVVAIPLTENMPSGHATKPGDVVIARNGLSIEVDNTDAEGRLILADALHYVADVHSPACTVELSTLTGAMDVALGTGYAGVFSTSDALWKQLEKAGEASGDPSEAGSGVYKKAIRSEVADLKNVGGRGAGSCTAAAFLAEFVKPGVQGEGKTAVDAEKEDDADTEGEKVKFAHIDIAGVMQHAAAGGYIGKGMTGRPVRSIIEFVRSYDPSK